MPLVSIVVVGECAEGVIVTVMLFIFAPFFSFEQRKFPKMVEVFLPANLLNIE